MKKASLSGHGCVLTVSAGHLGVEESLVRKHWGQWALSPGGGVIDLRGLGGGGVVTAGDEGHLLGPGSEEAAEEQTPGQHRDGWLAT